jgi:hypothetical protein
MRNRLLVGAACLLVSGASALAQEQEVYKVYFETNQSSLGTDGLQTVSNAATAFERGGTPRVMVTGYTDSTGSSAYNQRLSERRADSVREALEARGVPSSAITVTGAGEAGTGMSAGEGRPDAEDRRVDIAMEAPAPEPMATEPVPAPAPVMAAEPMETSSDGMFGGRFSLGGLYGFNMQDGDDDGQSSHLAGLNLGFDYGVTDYVALSLEQAVFYNFFSDDDGFGGRSAAGLDFTLGRGNVIPHIGANIGYLYGSGIEDDFFAGPEIGINLFGFDAKVAYDMPFDRSWDDGVILATVGLGIKF